MFGNNTTSSWANPQQNQQQPGQQATNAFGQPNAFGTGGAFGGGAFGQNQQPQQQQQPAVNPMFGNASTSTGTTGATGFGAFGNTGTSAFGAKPTTGFGAFGGGGTSAFGGAGTSTGAFGSTTATPSTTSAFGAQPATTSAFGGSSLFGTKPAATTNAFGAQTVAVANPDNPNGGVAPVSTGSSNPPYSAFTEKDSTGTQPVTLHYQSISCMPAYRGTSFEEVRCQDYAQGRKTAGAFGQSAAFGLAPQQTQPSTSTFGSTAAPATTGAFGAFGAPAQTAQPAAPSAFGAFGQPAATAQPSAFGTSTTGGNAFGGFGQQNQQQQPATNAFGAFGQPQQANQAGTTSTGLFGGGAFGAGGQQNKPFGGFGTAGTSAFGTGGAFGQSNQQQQQQQPAATGIFGQPNQQQQQPATTSAFGGTGAFGTGNSLFKPATAFGTQPTTGAFSAFGQNNQQQGQQQPQSTGLFGQPTTGGLFGQNQQQQQQQQGQQPQQQGTSLFGSTQPAVQQTGGLFGGGGLFGNNQAQKPATAFGGGLFGQNNANANATAAPAQGGLFGQPLGQSTNQQQTAGGLGAFGSGSSIFGSKPANAGASIFGQPNQQQQGGGTLGGSLFGNTLGGGNSNLGASPFTLGGSSMGTSTTAGQATLTASVAHPVSTNIPIFSLLPNPPGPLSSASDPPPKRASSFFVDVPTRSPVVGLTSSRNTGVNKLRGFGASTHVLSQSSFGSASVNRGFSGSTMILTSSQSPSKGGLADSRGLLGAQSFLSGGSEGRQSPKKLILDKKIDPIEVFGKPSAAQGAKVTFNPAMSFAAREKEGHILGSSKSGLGAPSTPKTAPGKLHAEKSSPSKSKSSEPKEGDYWLKPGLDELRNLSNNSLSTFKGLTVGRVGYGEVQFLDPVDLTSLPRLSALLGKVVQIDNKECSVYPDSVEGDDVKPPPGEGLNVRARIVLLGCWPVDKATREPIKDDKHPSFSKHLKRLKAIKRTYFEDYSIEDGKWTFTVDHF